MRVAEKLDWKGLNMTSLQSDVDLLFHTGTPLHVAVKKHSKKVNCSRTVAFLLSQGADVLAKVCTILLLHPS
jgi:hypothetical protein